MMSTEAIKIE